MKCFNFKLVLFTLGAFLTFSSFSTERTGTLVLTFHNLEVKNGYIEVSLFNQKKKFLKKGGAWKKQRIKVIPNQPIKVYFENIPFGTYAAAGYHDVNGNAKFDRTFIGLPKEPYLFSRTFKKKIRKPYFKEVNFNFETPSYELPVELQVF